MRKRILHLPVHERDGKTISGDPETDDRLRSAGLLAASAIHEVNNLISAMKAHAWLGLSSGNAEEALHAVLDVASEMESYSSSLLGLARGDETPEGPVDVAAALERTLALLRPLLTRTSVHVEREYQDAEPVRGRAARLGQVFVNLILNAQSAMPDGGRLRISVRPRRGVEVRIADEGGGLPPEVAARLFASETPPPGARVGLGLFVVRKIVREMRGTLEVEAVKGRGTTFILWFPLGG